MLIIGVVCIKDYAATLTVGTGVGFAFSIGESIVNCLTDDFPVVVVFDIAIVTLFAATTAFGAGYFVRNLCADRAARVSITYCTHIIDFLVCSIGGMKKCPASHDGGH
jgi:hypothetical protein